MKKPKKYKRFVPPNKSGWMIHNIDRDIKQHTIALIKMKGHRTISQGMDAILKEWIRSEAGSQLWKQMKGDGERS